MVREKLGSASDFIRCHVSAPGLKSLSSVGVLFFFGIGDHAGRLPQSWHHLQTSHHQTGLAGGQCHYVLSHLGRKAFNWVEQLSKSKCEKIGFPKPPDKGCKLISICSSPPHNFFAPPPLLSSPSLQVYSSSFSPPHRTSSTPPPLLP